MIAGNRTMKITAPIAPVELKAPTNAAMIEPNPNQKNSRKS